MRIVKYKELVKATKGLRPRAFWDYAHRVYRINKILGAWEKMHAEGADGNSPDVCEWPKSTFDEQFLLEDHNIKTEEQAREFYIRWYF